MSTAEATTTEAHERAVWLDWRRAGIGASDMPAILGVSPYRTALQLYEEKLGQAPEREPTVPMRAGTFLEPFMLELFEEATGESAREVQMRVEWRENPIFRATLDAVCHSGRIVELKSVETSEGLGEPGTDEVRADWIVQAHHQMLATGEGVVTFAVLVGKRDFRLYEVRRSDRLVGKIVEAGEAFWARVANRIPPEPTLPADAKAVARLYRPDDTEAALGSEVIDLADEYERLGEQSREVAAGREEAKARLILALGGHSVGLLPDGRRVKFTEVQVKERTQTIRAHTQSRVSILKAKG